MTVKAYLCSAVLAIASALSTAAKQADSALFPDLESYSQEEIKLHGLARLYPGRILFEPPQQSTNSLRDQAAKVEELTRGVKYIRIYRLEEALKLIETQIQHPALILDARYLQSSHSGSPLASMLGQNALLTQIQTVGQVPANLSTELKAQSQSPLPRKAPFIVLCNRETAGPFEAVLHNLQAAGAAIIVGEASAGRTGFYKQLPYKQIWKIEGEIRPTTQHSLVGIGIQPRIRVATSPEESYIAYHLYEAGTKLEKLLQAPKGTDESSSQDGPSLQTDPVLQRGFDIVTALQILN